MQFVRKVYSILAVQLTFTAAFIALVQTQLSLREFFFTGAGVMVYLACFVGYIVFAIMIFCCYGRVAPLNLYLLAGLTVCLTVMTGGITADYPKEIVLIAGGATALTTIALTVYAFNTKV